MTELCHYTDDQGSEKIIRSGRIMASLRKSGDAVFGNAVYLTKLTPATSTRAQVAQNNWLNTSDHSLNKTKNVFILEIPDNEVENVSTEARNLFIFGGRKDLRLVKYKWYLKDFDMDKIIASYKYHIGSTGPAASSSNAPLMGDYVMTEETVNGRPVYQQSRHSRTLNRFLSISSFGKWGVGQNTAKDYAWLRQKDKYSLGPDQEGPWNYADFDVDGKRCWKGDDATLKAYPWYLCSQWKSDYHRDSLVDTAYALTPATLSATSASPPAIITPAPATTASTHPSARLSTSANISDSDDNDGLLSARTTRFGRVLGGQTGKTTGRKRKLPLMLQRLG